MPKLAEKYEKGKVPAGLETFYTVEKDGFMFAEFEDDVALATNPALALQNTKIIGEKRDLQTKYDNLVTSSGDLARQVNELTTQVASGGQVSADELAIVTALKGIKDKTPAEIKKMVEEFPALQAQIDGFKTTQENSDIAKAMGWKPEVFSDLRPVLAKDLTFELTDVTEGEKTVKKVFVAGKDANGTDFKKEFSEYAKANPTFTNHLPSLSASGESGGPDWVPQSEANGGGNAGLNPLDAKIQNDNAAAKARGNPFNPAPPVVPAPPPSS